MSTEPETDALLAGARRYATDRVARTATMSAFERLAALDEHDLRSLVENLGRSRDPGDRALAALLAARLPIDQAAERLLALFGGERDMAVLLAAIEAAGSLPGAVWSHHIGRFA